MISSRAHENGYGNDLCGFLDVLEKNLDLYMAGADAVLEALDANLPEDDVIKVALANVGRVFCMSYSKTTLDTGVKPDWDFSPQDWIARGEEKFRRHLDENGKFRFSDFKLRKPGEGVPDKETLDGIRNRILVSARRRAATS